MKNNNGESSEVNQTKTLMYGALIHRYGPDISEDTIQIEVCQYYCPIGLKPGNWPNLHRIITIIFPKYLAIK